MKPVIKWVGGKTQMLPELESIIKPMLNGVNTYYEVFCGGGALAFDMAYENTVINDCNEELINMYKVIRGDKDRLMRMLDQLKATHCDKQYYDIRAWDRSTSKYSVMNKDEASCLVARAARTIYLNKTCFNGLYRVNSKGYFNAPIGRTSSGKTPELYDRENIEQLSKFLEEDCIIRCGSYVSALDTVETGDVVFLDPPYDQDEDIKSSGFVGYTKGGWTKEDTKNLRDICDGLRNVGVHVIITNNDTAYVRELFKDYEIREISVKRSINRDGSKRSGKEVIIIG